MLKNIFEKKQYDNKVIFIDIEKTIFLLENSTISETEIKQFEDEITKYNQINKYDYKLFHQISQTIFEYLNDTKKFSKEKEFMDYFIDINKEKLKSLPYNYCHLSFTAQIMTNWILLNLNTCYIDKSFFDKDEKIYFNRFELINKITTNFKMYLWFFDKNFNNFSKQKKDINHIIFTVLTLLQEKNILDVKNIPISIKKYNKISLTVEVFFSLTNYNNNINNNTLNFNIFINKPKIKIIKNNYFFGGFHYSTFFKIFKSNIKSNKIFNLEDKNFLDKVCSQKYKIDFTFYEKVYKLICNSLNIAAEKNSLEEYLKINLTGIYNQELYNKIEGKQTEEEIDNEKKIFQKKFSKILEYYLFTEIKKINNDFEGFYLGFQFDFRGRMYPKSCISPNSSKIIRLLYFYGYYSIDDLKQLNIKKIGNNYIDIIKKCLLFKLFDKIDFNNNIHLKYSLICLFEISKIFKNELSLKKNGIFSDIELLLFGNEIIENILKNDKKLSFDEELEYLYFRSALEDLNKGLYKKLVVYKDATASGIQLLTVVHGCKNEEILKNCNLRSYDLWYDTYTYIINLFIKKEIKNLKILANDDYLNFLERKDLKRSIMTYIYGAGKKTALRYYLENLSKKFDEKIGTKIFNIFYKFLDSFFGSNDFFKTPLNLIAKKAKNEHEKNKKITIKVSDGSTIRLDYYRMVYYRLDRIIEKDRNTIKYGEIDYNLYDSKKTERSIIANIAQGLDALFLRLILKELKYPIITIHDCFGIDIFNIDYLIYVANLSINKIHYSFDFEELNNADFKLYDYYSIYILI